MTSRGQDGAPEWLALYLEHRSLVRSVARRWLYDKASVEDIEQEAFLELWRRPPRWLGPGGAAAWLCVVARNLAVSRNRADAMPGRSFAGLDWLPLHAGAAQLELEEALAALPGVQRQAVVLHELAGFEVREIARLVMAPSGTVRTRLQRARQSLRRYFNGAAQAKKS
ncbi:MAG: RNA polymerase sigma factor [Terriglobales bacterium]